MGLSTDYHSYKEGSWKLWVVRKEWSVELWKDVAELIEKQPVSRHPQTVELHSPAADGGETFYLKVFHGASWVHAFKDLFRDSKAVRSMRQALVLANCDFKVPMSVASGEKREYGLLRKAFLLTRRVKGQALPVVLQQQYAIGARRASLSDKRSALRQLAAEIRRLHDLGFVHGDLVPTNIFVAGDPGKAIDIFLMDNDRTRRYPAWLPHSLWRRNLLQLNRMPLPGITLQDRIRFLKHYLGSREWGGKERRLLLWLECKTRQRRYECDAVDPNGSFRRLMRWSGGTT
jgi:serine/threonine protein kinase